MIVGTEVESHEAPGSTGIVTRRIDTDDGCVILLVSWLTRLGHTSMSWHRECDLTQSDTQGTGQNPTIPDGEYLD